MREEISIQDFIGNFSEYIEYRTAGWDFLPHFRGQRELREMIENWRSVRVAAQGDYRAREAQRKRPQRESAQWR